jgi:hypothetical protein
MIYLGTAVVPAGTARNREKVATYEITWPDGSKDEGELRFGDLVMYPKLKVDETAWIEIHPTRAFDVGEGKGRAVKAKLHGGVVGVVLDARGRPIVLPQNAEERRAQLLSWFSAMDAYPNLEKVLQSWQAEAVSARVA